MRSKARETALQYLYSVTVGDKNDGLFVAIAKSNELTKNDLDFSKTLIDLVFENKQKLIDTIKPYLENFSWDRVFFMDKLILILSFCEMAYVTDTPKKVVIDEAVNLASKFSGDNSPDFINGILAKYFKDVQNGNNN